MEGFVDTDFGKHDYDWLLTPPETPIVPSSKASDRQIPSQKSKSRPARSVSTTRASRVPSSQPPIIYSTKHTRSSSLTRPSILKSLNSLPTNNKNCSPSDKLYTCISSLSSKTSTPTKKLTTSTFHKDAPRDQNPIKARPTSKPQNSTLNSKSNSNLNSRSSTPSGKPTNRATSTGRSARASVHPIEILELPSEAPRNPRSSSSGKVHSVKGSVSRAGLDPQNAVSCFVGSKFLENSPRDMLTKSVVGSGPRRVNNSSGYGRNVSKNSIDMALKHMDIKQGIADIRNKIIIPPSIRSSSKQAQTSVKENNSKYNSITSSNLRAAMKNGTDTCASAQCDAMLSKEDKNSLNWLHNAEDKSDQSVVFDHREPLPEPF